MAVIVAVYGNRAYEDALIEMKDVVTELGFKPVAAGAFVGEHSFANEEFKIANGRPDADDLDQAAAFGKNIAEKLAGVSSSELDAIEVPGDRPYKDRRPQG